MILHMQKKNKKKNKKITEPIFKPQPARASGGINVVRVQASAFNVGSDVTMQRYSFLKVSIKIAHPCNVNRLYLTNKIPFLDVYEDINLVSHVIKSHKERRTVKTCQKLFGRSSALKEPGFNFTHTLHPRARVIIDVGLWRHNTINKSRTLAKELSTV